MKSFKFKAKMDLVNVDIIIKIIILLKKKLERINNGIIFWIDKIRNNASKFNDSLILIIQKWKGIIANLIKIVIFIIIKKIKEFLKLNWNLEIKNKDEENDWIMK